jgi:uncharacterized protein (TIGR03086 family)
VDQIEALLAALDAQQQFIGSARLADLSGPSRCPGWSDRDVLNHSLAVTLRFARFASGETDKPSLPEGDLVGDDPATSLRVAFSLTERAWVGTDRTRTCHLTFGSFGAQAAAGINLIDVLAHGWDMSPLQARTFAAPGDLWRVGLDCARTLIGPERDGRHYGPEIVPSSEASAEDRFLALVGRSDTSPGSP